jgi:hypothetical protein
MQIPGDEAELYPPGPVTAYPTARLIAPTVFERLERHVSSAQGTVGHAVATLPSAETIAAIVEAGFWASLRREEGRNPRISLAYLRPDEARHGLFFEHFVPLAPQPLTRIAPAVERPGIHLGVSEEGGELRVWGAVRVLPPHCFVLEVIAPGVLIIKQSPAEESGKFVNIAVLQGDEAKIVDQTAVRTPDRFHFLTSLLGFESPNHGIESLSVLIQLAVSMRTHGRGGTLLVTPAGTENWRESAAHPIVYSVQPPFSVLADLMQAETETRLERPWQDALRRAIDAVAGLTAVDGAAVLTDRYELLAFGVKIVRRSRHAVVRRVIVTEPIENSTAEAVHPAQLGGARHLSAAQFVHDQQDSIALVASQDGRFTVFAWSPQEQSVHGHRIETLLL